MTDHQKKRRQRKAAATAQPQPKAPQAETPRVKAVEARTPHGSFAATKTSMKEASKTQAVPMETPEVEASRMKTPQAEATQAERLTPTTLTHKPPRTTNGLGVAALTMGVVAAATFWMPTIGTVASGVAIAGAVLAMAGILLAATARRWDLNAPFAALVICGVAIAAQVLMTAAPPRPAADDGGTADGAAQVADVDAADPAATPTTQPAAAAATGDDAIVATADEGRLAEAAPAAETGGAQTGTPSRDDAEPQAARADLDAAEAAATSPEALLALQLVDVHTGRTVLGDPGVFMQARNVSDRPIRTFTVRVYALDARGRPVWNRAFRPIHPDHDDVTRRAPLAAHGGSTSFGYALDELAADHDGSIRVEIERVEFADTFREVVRQLP